MIVHDFELRKDIVYKCATQPQLNRSTALGQQKNMSIILLKSDADFSFCKSFFDLV